MNKNILVADDHHFILDSIKMLLESSGEYAVTTCTNLQDALDAIEEVDGFDAVILDYRMPGMNGLIGLEAAIKANRGKPVAIISGTASHNLAPDIIRLGGHGLISKNLNHEDMTSAIQVILLRQVYVSRDTITAQNGRDDDDTDIPKLTAREDDVLYQLSMAKSNQDIADSLEISEGTVKVFVRRIMKKMNASNRMDAVIKAQDLGLL